MAKTVSASNNMPDQRRKRIAAVRAAHVATVRQPDAHHFRAVTGRQRLGVTARPVVPGHQVANHPIAQSQPAHRAKA